jgi:peptide/nickel transport system permease protein
VILLFYLLVTPEIVETGIPSYMATVLFLFPILFVGILNIRATAPRQRYVWLTLAPVLAVMFWIYFSLINSRARRSPSCPAGSTSSTCLRASSWSSSRWSSSTRPPCSASSEASTMDIKTRDYVAAAQTRGESVWYIMLWEILPNARGPLIVDFCLRIGYTTILLGTLGFFGLGLSPDSPDWGSTINAGRQLLSIFPHPAIVPAMALLSLVLGLNLLADGLREESLKD